MTDECQSYQVSGVASWNYCKTECSLCLLHVIDGATYPINLLKFDKSDAMDTWLIYRLQCFTSILVYFFRRVTILNSIARLTQLLMCVLHVAQACKPLS